MASSCGNNEPNSGVPLLDKADHDSDDNARGDGLQNKKYITVFLGALSVFMMGGLVFGFNSLVSSPYTLTAPRDLSLIHI